jgi:hypothetical protein
MNYEVEREGFVAEYKHRIIRLPALAEEEARNIAELIMHIIDDLATKYVVYIRRMPEYTRDIDFETMQHKWYVTCRYSFTEPTKVKPAGKYNLRTYDNDSVSGFGLG